MISSTPIVSLLWAQLGHNGGTIGHNWEMAVLLAMTACFSAPTRGYREYTAPSLMAGRIRPQPDDSRLESTGTPASSMGAADEPAEAGAA